MPNIDAGGADAFGEGWRKEVSKHEYTYRLEVVWNMCARNLLTMREVAGRGLRLV
jgi:hypothetical protein